MTAAVEGGEWSAARSGHTLTPGKNRTQFTGGWVGPGTVWAGGKSRPHRDSILDRPARSSVTILTELPGIHRERYFTRNAYENECQGCLIF